MLFALLEICLESGISRHVLILDAGPELVAEAVRSRLADLGAATFFFEPGSLPENGYVASFNGRIRDELLDGEIVLHGRGGQYPDREMAPALQRPALAQHSRATPAAARDARLAGRLTR